MPVKLNGTLTWVKNLAPIIVVGIIGLVAAGRIDARMSGAEQRLGHHEAELRVYRKTSADLLKKVSRIEGYMRALSERPPTERNDP